MFLEYTVAQTVEDLSQILRLQKANLPSAVSDSEAKVEGFVTVNHDFALLERMNRPYPHIVAKEGGKVVGYALVELKSFSKEIPALLPMFEEVNKLEYQTQSLETSNFFVMGQICIAKTHRRKGLFKGLYKEMVNRMQQDFDFIITEVALRNTRSLNAHYAVGFENIKEYQHGAEEQWVILLLDMKNQRTKDDVKTH